MAILGIVSKIFLFFFFFFLSKHANAAFSPTQNTVYGCLNGTFELSQQNTLGVTTLLSELVAHSSTESFYSSSSNSSGLNNTVYGQFYCTGNVDSIVCQSCVQKAASTLEANCKNYKAAVVFDKECTLRYSNNTVYGVVDDIAGWLYSYSPYYSDQFNQTVYSTLDTAVKQATNNGSSKGFATGDASLVGKTERLFVLAQCSLDIIGSSCQDCLESALENLAGCCVDTIWGIKRRSITVFLSSCQLGFEVKDTSTNHGTPSSSPESSEMNVWYIMLPLVVAAFAWY